MLEARKPITVLEAQLAELESRQQHVQADLSVPLSSDSAERVTELEDEQALEGEAALIAKEILSVRRALARLENGSYGLCVRCGEQIAPERLLARPEAALCIRCAQQG